MQTGQSYIGLRGFSGKCLSPQFLINSNMASSHIVAHIAITIKDVMITFSIIIFVVHLKRFRCNGLNPSGQGGVSFYGYTLISIIVSLNQLSALLCPSCVNVIMFICVSSMYCVNISVPVCPSVIAVFGAENDIPAAVIL
jgi:hypothetical protein